MVNAIWSIFCFIAALHSSARAFSYVSNGRINGQIWSILHPTNTNDNDVGCSIKNARCASTYTRRTKLVLLNSIDDNSDEVNGKQPQKWRKLQKLNPIPVVLKMYAQIMKAQSNFRLKFQSLSKKGKIIVSMQLMAFLLIFGSATNQIIASVRSDTNGNLVKMERTKPVEVPYSVFMDMVEKSGKGHSPGKNPAIKVNDIIIGKERIHFRLNQDQAKHQEALTNSKLVQKNDVSTKSIAPRSVYTNKVDANPELIKFLRSNQIPFKAASKSKSDAMAVFARSSILIIYMLFLVRMYKSMSGGSSGDTPGKLARLRQGRNGEDSVVQFNDIEGIDEAKFEVMELVDSLRNPGKYAILGARAPRGLLLEGPPGTGKTMLARACAGSAGVPLLYCSGSDFVEMFVGRGAARVRKTFERAGKIAPCIIFIDELDALGKSRTSSEMMGMQMRSNDEAEQTLNQLLACMDGLDSNKGICVLAATNRREVLDPALIRPGRFDRIIQVRLPDVKGRERILRVHAQKLPGFKECQGVDDKRNGSLGKGFAVDLSAIAAVTSGLSGAELEFIVNEAAIRAVRRVSTALREGKEPNDIKSPHVCAMDFEMSVKSFFETRKISKGVGDVFSNVLRPKIT